ncbi:Uncharacterised protein [[Clostridium] sordellii]|nr:Uncharacterised protein [[Clostridium] sordellii] [Paeniclostridium sordellii]
MLTQKIEKEIRIFMEIYNDEDKDISSIMHTMEE